MWLLSCPLAICALWGSIVKKAITIACTHLQQSIWFWQCWITAPSLGCCVILSSADRIGGCSPGQLATVAQGFVVFSLATSRFRSSRQHFVSECPFPVTFSTVCFRTQCLRSRNGYFSFPQGRKMKLRTLEGWAWTEIILGKLLRN